jgi:hypothetical protein
VKVAAAAPAVALSKARLEKESCAHKALKAAAKIKE